MYTPITLFHNLISFTRRFARTTIEAVRTIASVGTYLNKFLYTQFEGYSVVARQCNALRKYAQL